MEPEESKTEPRTYYTYKITASDSDKYYYGVSHVKVANSSIDQCLKSRYFGSGGVKFSNWKARHKATLQKQVLSVFAIREEAFEAEKALIGDLYKTDPLCLNSTTGGKDAGPVIVGVNLRECSIHGLVAHNDDYCYSCLADDRYSLKECPTHGLTKHSGESCYTCVSRGTFSQKECAIHGLTTFRGDSCDKCTQVAAVSMKECSLHGLTKHIGEVCYRCIALDAETYNEAVCEIHGKVLFRRNSCATCSAQSSITTLDCSIHGLTKHKGGKCCTCLVLKSVSEMDCAIHGVVKTQNGLCSHCESSKKCYLANCEIHGESKHRTSSGSCIRCESAARNGLRICIIHGETLHQSDSCLKCSSLKGIHTRDHVKKSKPKADCSLCVEAGLLPSAGTP